MVMDEFKLGSAGGPLTLVMSILTQSPLSLDLSVHEHLLALAGNLLSGACLSALKQGKSTAGEFLIHFDICFCFMLCAT